MGPLRLAGYPNHTRHQASKDNVLPKGAGAKFPGANAAEKKGPAGTSKNGGSVAENYKKNIAISPPGEKHYFYRTPVAEDLHTKPVRRKSAHSRVSVKKNKGTAGLARKNLSAQQGKPAQLPLFYFHLTYPAVPLFFFALTLLSPYPAFRLPLTLLSCAYFIFTYPAVPLFFFALTLLCPLSRFSLTTYPAELPLSRFSLTTYPAMPLAMLTYTHQNADT